MLRVDSHAPNKIMSRSKRLMMLALLASFAVVPLAAVQAATYTAQEKTNMKLVTDLYAALDEGDARGDLKQRVRGIAEKYLRPDYVQHTAGAVQYGENREGFIRMFESRPDPGAGGRPPIKTRILNIMGEGDLVMIIRVAMPDSSGKPSYFFDMFRAKDGKLSEHWNNPPPAALASR